jgi:SWI/SNF-related matrix-associated actin-dependent regulator of chromatin subfamily A member 5
MSNNNNKKSQVEKEDQDEQMNDIDEPKSDEEKKDESDENLDDMEIDEADLADDNQDNDARSDEEDELEGVPKDVADMARKDKERLKKIKLEQKKALEGLRTKQNELFAADQAKSANNRLKYLLDQTEIFTHFVKAGSGLQKSQEKVQATPTKRRGASSEQDDKEIMEEEEEEAESHFVTRWTVSPPFVKNGEMKDYQLQGLNWLIKLYDNGINGILADEMGLGKTLQTVALLCYLKEVRGVHGPHIVIVPKSTMGNWKNEFKKWVPSMDVVTFHGNKEEREEQKKTLLKPGKFDVVITTYEMAIREKAAFKQFNWRYLIIDEAHRIKNEKSVLSMVVRLYKSQYRLLITGTPLQNNLHELWALLNFLLPDVFSSSEDFDAWFNLKGGEENAQEVITKLHRVLRPFLLRRIKAEVAQGLPPKKEVKIFVGMSKMQRDLYTNILMKDIDAINGNGGSRTRLLNIVMQLRKACNHPYLFPGQEPGPPYEDGPHLFENCGKLVVLQKLLERLKASGSQILIFSQMTKNLDILEDYCLYQKYEYCRIDGSTNTIDREEQIDSFVKKGSSKFVFLLSTRAGGLGINLASADTVVLYDSDWNPQVDLQAQDRAHRIGQTKPVTVYRFITEGTIEEKIVERAEMKLHLDAVVIQQGRLIEQSKALGKDEMLAMIKFGAEKIFASKDSTISDEEIDAILERGAAKTEELAEKYKDKANNLLNFTLDGGNNQNYYNFEGVDYSQKQLARTFIEPPKRERKQSTYNESQYYKQLMGGSKEKKERVPSRPPKQPVIHPFQFFPKRLTELLNKETEAFKRRLEAREKKDKEKEEAAKEGNEKEEKDEDSEDFDDLTEGEQKEKDTLLQKGFGNWNKRDFGLFIKACEKYGRDALEQIAGDIDTKTLAEVKEYSKVFWKKYKEVPDWERIVSNIEKGEQRIQRREEMITALKYKIDGVKDPFKNLKINYAGNKGKTYTEEEDIFLVCATHALGYGNWDELKREIRKSWRFRFDWFLKSRTIFELQRRVDQLIRLIEKELSDAKVNLKPKKTTPKKEKETKKTTEKKTTPKKEEKETKKAQKAQTPPKRGKKEEPKEEEKDEESSKEEEKSDEESQEESKEESKEQSDDESKEESDKEDSGSEQEESKEESEEQIEEPKRARRGSTGSNTNAKKPAPKAKSAAKPKAAPAKKSAAKDKSKAAAKEKPAAKAAAKEKPTAKGKAATKKDTAASKKRKREETTKNEGPAKKKQKSKK